MLSAVIFDVDGTLADTEEAHRCAFNETFRVFGLPWDWEPTLYRRLLAIAGGKERIRHYMRECCPDRLAAPDAEDLIEHLHRQKTQRYGTMIAGGAIAPRPGVLRLIRELRTAGVRLAIATTTSRANVEALLRGSLGALPAATFEVIGAGEQAADKKPSPAVYRWVLTHLDLPPRRCLAIEDSENGVRAATGAGLSVVVTESTWSHGDDFTGCLAAVSDLGEPDAPFRLLAGEGHGRDWVDVALLRLWLAAVS